MTKSQTEDIPRISTPASMAGSVSSTSSGRSLAEEGYAALQELERILFFTDLPDDAARLDAAQEGLDALDKLEELLETSKVDMNRIQSTTSKTSTHSRTSTISRATAASSKSTALVDWNTMNMMDVLKAHFDKIIKAGEHAVKEGERVVFFTDLDRAKLAHELQLAGSHPEDILKEVDLVISEMNSKLTALKEDVGNRSHNAYKECERTLLFTDLDEVKLAKDLATNKDDLLLHFLHNQDVGKELEHKFQKNYAGKLA